MREDLEKLREQLAPMLALSKAALKDLALGNGTHWKEAVGELQSQDNQIAIWILLYEDGDLVQTHASVCEALQPHMHGLAPLETVLFYNVLIGDDAFAAKLSGNDAIFLAETDGTIDLEWYRRSMGLPSVFTARDSRRTA